MPQQRDRRRSHHDSEPPSESVRDSREISADSLLKEYREEAEARRAAQARAEALELELVALRAEPAARGPSFGNLKWWMVALGTVTAVCAMLGGILEVIAKVRELDRPVASAAQVVDVKQDLTDRDAREAKRDADEKKRHEDEDQRARLLGAFMCALGFRAKGLDCDSALRQVDFEAQPLSSPNKVHAAPTWKTRSTWPSPPDAPDL